MCVTSRFAVANARYAAFAITLGHTATSRSLHQSGHLQAKAIAGSTDGFRGEIDIEVVLLRSSILNIFYPHWRIELHPNELCGSADTTPLVTYICILT